MKKSIAIAAVLLLVTLLQAQAPQEMGFQAVIRNAGGLLVKNTAVGMRVSILHNTSTGTAVYVETQTPTTNANGLASIKVGNGAVLSGSFAIDWSSGPYFIKTETDPAGGSNYTISGTQQLLSVPYALYAEKTAPVDLGQASANYYGTGYTFVSATDTAYKLILGLSQVISVPVGATTLLQTTGTAYGTQFNAWALLTVGLFLDGSLVNPGGVCLVYVVTDDNLSSGGGTWALNYPVALGAGSHTIEIKAKGNLQNQTPLTIDNGGSFGNSTLTVTFLKN